MIRPILRHGAGVLHTPARPVDAITPDILQLIDDMIQTMYVAPGIGLAAPQVGVGLRIFVADISVGRNPAEVLRVLDALQTDELCPCNWQKGEDVLKAA